MLAITYSRAYRKSLKKILKSGNFKKEKLAEVLNKLLNKKVLEQNHKDHELNGVMTGLRECHIENDLLLVYEINNNLGRLHLVNIGSHSELFD